MTAPRLDRGLAMAAARALDPVVRKDDRSVLRAIPVMIHTSGLAAACAYLLSRAKGDRNDRFYRATKAILTEAALAVGAIDHAAVDTVDAARLLDIVVNHESYALAERRARAFAVWLARIAEARAEPPRKEEDQ
ncbi:MAG: type III-B CRISPR module-associated protein Cmr5 [Sciscionella sp.]